MTEEKKKKRVLKVAGLVLCAVLAIALGSYAYWQLTEKQSNKNVVGTACLDIDIVSESGDISLKNAWPISDSEGADLEPYTFKITNKCGKAVNYSVGLESIAAQDEESTSYLNYDYIRVKLDNGNVKTYGALDELTNDINQPYTIRDTKEIVHHTLGANESVTHNLRLWVYENTPLKNDDGTYNTEKYFYGKIRVVAGQNIEGDTPVTIGVVNGDINTVGSEVQIGDEHFYVIGDDSETEGNVKLLAKYNLLVGESNYLNENIHNQSACEAAGNEWDGEMCFVSETYTSSTSGYNRQASTAKMASKEKRKYISYNVDDQTLCENVGGSFVERDSKCEFAVRLSDTRFDNLSELGDADIDYKYNDDVVNVYEAVAFANSPYWIENDNLKSDYSIQNDQMFPYIYYSNNKTIDSENNVALYVNNYKNILENDYRITINDARLISVEEFISLGCEMDSNDEADCSSAPSWVFSSGYWMGSFLPDPDDYEILCTVNYDGQNVIRSKGYDKLMIGVRPVISVSKGLFN